MPRLPLSDIKVVDITSVIAGPVCGKLLAQMGADVIHIEPPWGDDGRNSTSPFMGREGGTFVASNQGKRGICVDLRKDEGREIVRQFGVSARHRREDFYTVIGNHDAAWVPDRGPE